MYQDGALFTTGDMGDGAALVPSLAAPVERPSHYRYLTEFRVEPCALFKQHQCHQHRPYTCFHWHFANQRRRRPTRRRDGTFNYSADVYCARYDENAGQCDDGDECPLLHRVAGDVERKYHLRYYKTALCVHSTDSKGVCAKNGQHCAFAHNVDDLRLPIFDIRELVQGSDVSSTEMLEQKERTSFVVDDPVWQDQEHVLSFYKTDTCKKPPRLCRQGYACPFYHNTKDRRRPPGAFKYRSTPCPNAKCADEWVEPDVCDSGDHCPYCHSRTEQQFHPEIYKSTKCNDMLQHGYCPRGPFCAFAHTDAELHADRALSKAPPPRASTAASARSGGAAPTSWLSPRVDIAEAPSAPQSVTRSLSDHSNSFGSPTSVGLVSAGSAPTYSSILKQRQTAGSGAKATAAANYLNRCLPGSPLLSNSYPKAPGYERGHQSVSPVWSADLQRSRLSQSAAPLSHLLDLGRRRVTDEEAARRTTGCTLMSGETDGASSAGGSLRSSSFSPLGPVAAPPQGLLDDLSLDELTLAPIAEREEGDLAGRAQTAILGAFGSSAPMAIPSSNLTAAGAALFGVASPPPVAAAADSAHDHLFSMSGSFGQREFIQCDLSQAEALNSQVLLTELQRTRDELASYKIRLGSWEEGLKQARQACQAWKREADDHKRRAQQADAERQVALTERDAALAQLEAVKGEVRSEQSGAAPVANSCGMELLNGNQLEQFHTYLRSELERVEAQLQQRGAGPVCGRCGRNVNGSTGAGGCPVCSQNSKNGLAT